jgi:hypothetical protein
MESTAPGVKIRPSVKTATVGSAARFAEGLMNPPSDVTSRRRAALSADGDGDAVAVAETVGAGVGLGDAAGGDAAGVAEEAHAASAIEARARAKVLTGRTDSLQAGRGGAAFPR